jgi:hypothetical protein
VINLIATLAKLARREDLIASLASSLGAIRVARIQTSHGLGALGLFPPFLGSLNGSP